MLSSSSVQTQRPKISGSRSKFSPEFLEALKSKVNILEVVGEHVVLRKSGANFVGLCPFHNERSPSFSVSESKQVYHCYGCQKGGDLIRFVSELHGMSFREAVEDLADRAKLALPKDYEVMEGEDPAAAKRRIEQREKQATALKLNRFVSAFYHHQLQSQRHIVEYFNKRGVQGELARNFYVGAAPPSWDALASHLVQSQAPLDLAVELGLIRPSTKQNGAKGPGYFDTFRNRAIFPVLDNRGKVAGFGGRALALPPGAPDVGGESPKYLNSSESLVFHKSRLAFGLFQAQKHIREKDEVVIVEGYFDVTALHAGGFQNAVAISGTSLTSDHLALFKRLGKKVTLLLDADRAGIAATERAMLMGLEKGEVFYGARMPAGLDPDELLFDSKTGLAIPTGKEQMTQVLLQSRPILDVRIEEEIQAAQKTGGAEARAQALKTISAWLLKFNDPVGREIRVQWVERDLQISRQHFLPQHPQKQNQPPPQVQQAPQFQNIRQNSGQNFVQNNAQFNGQHNGQFNGMSSGFTPRFKKEPKLSLTQRISQQQDAQERNMLRGRSGQQTRPVPLSSREKILLWALALGGAYSQWIAQARKQLPLKVTFSDFFDYFPARDLVTSLFTQPGVLERFRATPQAFLEEIEDPQLRATFTEALVSQGEGAQPLFEEQDLKMALGQSTTRALERFSHQLKLAVSQAEAKKDAELHAVLLKEYLDVQRKLKEFSTFYDQV